MPLVSEFSQRSSPFPSPLHSCATPFSPHFTLVGSQDPDFKSPACAANKEWTAGRLIFDVAVHKCHTGGLDVAAATTPLLPVNCRGLRRTPGVLYIISASSARVKSAMFPPTCRRHVLTCKQQWPSLRMRRLDVSWRLLPTCPCSELRHENKELRHENKELRHENKELRHENKELRHENKELRHENKELRHENKELRHEPDTENKELRHENKELRHENKELRHENKELRHENKELRHENKELRHENQELRHENKESLAKMIPAHEPLRGAVRRVGGRGNDAHKCTACRRLQPARRHSTVCRKKEEDTACWRSVLPACSQANVLWQPQRYTLRVWQAHVEPSTSLLAPSLLPTLLIQAVHGQRKNAMHLFPFRVFFQKCLRFVYMYLKDHSQWPITRKARSRTSCCQSADGHAHKKDFRDIWSCSDYSPLPKANRVQSPAGSLPEFRMWESCRTTSLIDGFSRESPISPRLHSSAAPFSPHLTLFRLSIPHCLAVVTHWTRIREDPGSIFRSGHADFGFPWFSEITPGECGDAPQTKAMADSFPILPPIPLPCATCTVSIDLAVHDGVGMKLRINNLERRMKADVKGAYEMTQNAPVIGQGWRTRDIRGCWRGGGVAEAIGPASCTAGQLTAHRTPVTSVAAPLPSHVLPGRRIVIRQFCHSHCPSASSLRTVCCLMAVHDKVSIFEINLRKKSLLLPACILTGALSDMRPVNLSVDSQLTAIVTSRGGSHSRRLSVRANYYVSGRGHTGCWQNYFTLNYSTRPTAALVIYIDELVWRCTGDSLSRCKRLFLLRAHMVSLLSSHQGDLGSIPGRATPNLRTWKSCRMIPLVGDLPFPPAPPLFRRCFILLSIALIGSPDLYVKSLLILRKAREYTMCIQVDLKQGFQKCSFYREQPLKECNDTRGQADTQTSPLTAVYCWCPDKVSPFDSHVHKRRVWLLLKITEISDVSSVYVSSNETVSVISKYSACHTRLSSRRALLTDSQKRLPDAISDRQDEISSIGTIAHVTEIIESVKTGVSERGARLMTRTANYSRLRSEPLEHLDLVNWAMSWIV
ncbi:hypothetical protein PR048_029929 [Dryococelus australis]|uniref:Uncharacterized protein n=1 Tax=Dryococelus australis TaxID=614101 RepID=A0ABQ9G811_9NEOP|nr:hypothetical protein PR048_029929 [Dryococelus australis]